MPGSFPPCLETLPAVASLIDLAATKMAVVQSRAESKDYRDVAELIAAGVWTRPSPRRAPRMAPPSIRS